MQTILWRLWTFYQLFIAAAVRRTRTTKKGQMMKCFAPSELLARIALRLQSAVDSLHGGIFRQLACPVDNRLWPFGVILIHQRRGTDFLFTALMANHADQVRPAELEILFLAKFVELLQVNTCHGPPPSVSWPTAT
jgi:hypothetical protein